MEIATKADWRLEKRKYKRKDGSIAFSGRLRYRGSDRKPYRIRKSDGNQSAYITEDELSEFVGKPRGATGAFSGTGRRSTALQKDERGDWWQNDGNNSFRELDMEERRARGD